MNATTRDSQGSAERQAARRGLLQGMPGQRRGVLLLVVLSMLTLFMMLGTAYLVVATRSRETARAFSKLSLRSDNVRLPHSQLLDTVLLRVLRGTDGAPAFTIAEPARSAVGGTLTAAFESILADKYGLNTLLGTANLGGSSGNLAIYEVAPLLIAPSVTFDSLPNPFQATDLNGRIVTILGTGREPSSHRILQATDNGNGTYKLAFDNQPRNRPYEDVSASTPIRVVVNGREFTGGGKAIDNAVNESWDGFDDDNPFLSGVFPADLGNVTGSIQPSVSSSVIRKAGFVGSGTSAAVLSLLTTTSNGFSYGADNDNDGVNDGFYLDFGLPTVITPNGDSLLLHASVLVVDLDGRVNVNAHGSLSTLAYPSNSISGTHSYWPTKPAANTFAPVPMGSGYGPPEVNIDLLFPSDASTYPSQRLQGSYTNASSNSSPAENPALYLRTGVSAGRLSDASAGGISPLGSRFSGGSSTTPRLPDCEGRYGLPQTGVPLASFPPWWLNARYPFNMTFQIGASPGSLAWPGKAASDDIASAINDHRSPFDPTTGGFPRTYGNFGVPPLWWNVDDGASFIWTVSSFKVGAYTYAMPPRQTYNSPPDLHGRMKTTAIAAGTGGVVPQICFAKAEWSTTSKKDVESRDDPYEIRLDARAPRNTGMTISGVIEPYGNLFNLSELENILRPYDIDSSKLPPRLEAILGSAAEEARLRITTDSWDTTALTGTAAKLVFDAARTLSSNLGGNAAQIYGTSAVSGVFGRETARGEKFDLNRPLTGTKPATYNAKDTYYVQRQAYFKDLYVLLWSLSTANGGFNADKCAQWAANVVEFRDADSTMTPFEYDIDPSNGWDVDGDATTIDGAAQRKLVFGAERPELVITETSAWEDATTGELFVMLHRPWNAKAYGYSSKNSAQNSVAAEAVDPALDAYTGNLATNAPLDQLDLGRKSAGTLVNNVGDKTTYPVWRLRIVDSNGATSYVRCDSTQAKGASELVSTAITSAATPRLPADGWLCLMGTNTLPVTIDGTAKTATFTSFRVPGTAGPVGVNRNATIFLERLTDPTATLQNNSWSDSPTTPPSDLTAAQLKGMAIYRVVDQATVQVVNRTKDSSGAIPLTATPSKTTRVASGPTAFWKSDFPAPTPAAAITLGPLAAGASPNNPVWFPWSNRPLVGSPELFLVHALDCTTLLQNYSKPSLDPTAAADTYLAALLKTLKNPPLLDAVHVPTRFAAIHGSTSDPAGNLVQNTSIDLVTTPVNQLSSFREPGRVNLNTVTADDVWNAVVAGPLVNNSGVADPVKTRAATNFTGLPARDMASLLAFKGGAPPANPQALTEDANSVLATAKQLNPAQGLYTATRLSNTVTPRSHLFGVWITLRESVAAPGSPTPADPDSVRYHRAFYVIDRSIPVAHEPGKDHNVWDAVLLRRTVE